MLGPTIMQNNEKRRSKLYAILNKNRVPMGARAQAPPRQEERKILYIRKGDEKNYILSIDQTIVLMKFYKN